MKATKKRVLTSLESDPKHSSGEKLNPLMRQLFDSAQVNGRAERIRIDRKNRKIVYKAPKGRLFFIDAQPEDKGIEPDVRALLTEIESDTDHDSVLSMSRVCLAGNLRNWDLKRILQQCDLWERGYELFKDGRVIADGNGQLSQSGSDVSTENNVRNLQLLRNWLRERFSQVAVV